MKISTIFTITFLVWAAYDTSLFRRRRENYSSGSSSFSYEVETGTRRETRQKKFLKQTVIPPWYKTPPPKLKMKVNHFSGKTKDPRYSDQRKIRRRINNM